MGQFEGAKNMLTNNYDKNRNIAGFPNKILVSHNMEISTALRIEIKNQYPVELIDLTGSFFCIADEYKRFMEAEYGELQKEHITLYVQDLKSGSIIADLINNAPALLPLIAATENIESIIRYASYLKNIYDYLLGKTNNRPNIKKANYQNIAGFVEPIAKDQASQVNTYTVYHNQPTLIMNLDSISANAIQNAAKREIGLLSEPTTGIYKNVVFYWHQTRNDAASQAGDKVIIESIAAFPVKAIFDNEKVKRKAVWCEENPLTSGYLADISVETIQGRPVVYKILDVHDRVDFPAQTNLLTK